MKGRMVRLCLFLILCVFVSNMSADAQATAARQAGAIRGKHQPGAETPGFNSIDTTPILNFVNSRPVPRNAYRVLFIGDSLTLHGKIPHLWNVWSGMAATSPAHDFVHLTTSHLQWELAPCPVEIFYDNGGNGKLPQMLAYLETHPALNPSLVVLQGGENDPFNANFKKTYTALLDHFHSKTQMIVLGDFWSTQKEGFEKEQAEARVRPFVDIHAIQKDPVMTGNGGPYDIPGVAAHPNDKGMQAIAEAIESRFDRSVFPGISGKARTGQCFSVAH